MIFDFVQRIFIQVKRVLKSNFDENDMFSSIKGAPFCDIDANLNF